MPFSQYVGSTPNPAVLDEDGLDTSSKFYQERKKILTDNPYYYSNKLESDYERLKADTDKDGLISKEEYETFIVSSVEHKKSTQVVNDVKSIDLTVVVSVAIVCFTLIILVFSYLFLRRR